MPIEFDELDLNKAFDDEQLVPDQMEFEPLIDPVERTKVNMGQAMEFDPDQHASDLKLSRESGLDVNAVQTGRDAVQKRIQFDQLDLDAAFDKAPKTVKFLNTSPDNAIMAQDDVDRMVDIEGVINWYTEDYLQGLFDIFRSVPSGAVQGTSMSVSGAGNILEMMNRNVARGLDAILPEGADKYLYMQEDTPEIIRAAGYADPSYLLKYMGAGGKQIAADIGAPEDRQNIATDIAGAVGQMIPQIATAITAPQVAIPMLFSQGVDQQATRQEQTGTLGESVQSDLALLTGGAITAGTEKLGLDAILDRVPPKIKNDIARKLVDIGMAGGIEAVQEVVEGVSHSVLEYYTTNPDAEIFEGLDREAIAAGGAGAIMRALVTSLVPGRARDVSDDTAWKNNMIAMEQHKIDELNKLIPDSELKRRDPEAFRQFIAEADPDGVVYIDGAQTALYLQTKTRDEIANDPALTALNEQVNEAAALDGDVVIPMSDFATDFNGTEHFDALRPGMTLSTETVAPIRQAQSVQADQAYVSSLIAEAEQNVSEYVEAQEIYQNTIAQLVDSGRMSAKEAGVAAQVVPAYFTVHAKRNGISVQEAYNKAGLTIEGPMTGEMARLSPEAMTQFSDDVNLEKLIAEFDELFPESQVKDASQYIFDSSSTVERQRRLLESTGLDQDAAWTDERLDRAIRDGYSIPSDSTDVRIAFVNPADFVNATHPDPQEIADEAGDLDVEQLQGESQTPFLWIGDNGEIVGHEGRHRMAALSKAGITRVPVQMRFMDGTDFADTIDESRPYQFKGQDFGVDGAGIELTVPESYLAHPDNTEVIKQAMGQPELVFQETIQPGQASAADFTAALSDARTANKKGLSVAVFDQSEYEVMDTYLFDDGRMGFAIEHDGTLTGVFKHPDSEVENAIDVLVPAAIRAGATRLDAFEGFLTEAYARHGFKEVHRVEWDDQYSPEGWNKEKDGTPDVVYMELSDEARQNVLRRTYAQPVQETGGLRRGGERVQQEERTGRREIPPLENAPSVEGFIGPDPRLVEVAETYARSIGVDLKRQSSYVDVDVERAARIADAYEQMEHNPSDPVVKEAYDNLIRQTVAQYQSLVDAGYQFWFADMSREDNQDYMSTPWNAMRDIRANKQMGVYPTDDGFGTSEFDPTGNPLMSETQFQWPIGGPDSTETAVVRANDLFRAVHDAFGHGLEGAGFRARGEENAWQAHIRLFTGSAVGAITSETRGQNSWLNYGPHGESNRTASVEDTVFADQKTGLMPEWTWTEGVVGDQPEQSDGTPKPFEKFYQKEVTPAAQAQRNSIGLYSQVEQSIIDMPLPQWKKKKVQPHPEIKELSDHIDQLVQRNIELRQQERAELGTLDADLDRLQSDPNVTPEQVQEALDRDNERGLELERAFRPREAEIRQLQKVLEVMRREKVLSREEAEFLMDTAANPIVSSADPRNEQAQKIEKKRRKAMPTAKGKAVWEKLRGMPGVKQEELEWLGIEEFLLSEDSLTRDEVLEFVRSNGVVVVETEASESVSEDFEIEWSEEIDDDSENWTHRVEDFMYEYDLGDVDETVKDQIVDDLIAEEDSYIRQSLDLDDDHDLESDSDVLEWVDEQFSNEIRDKYEEAMEKRAEEEYMDDPIKIWNDADNIVRIVGSDDRGYHVTSLQYGDIVASDIWSFSEAEIQALDYLRENGDLREQGEDVAKWEEYVTEGSYDNYRELKLKLPELENTGDFYYDMHFEDANIVAFLRVTDRELFDGQPVVTDETVYDIDFRIVDNPVPGAVVTEIIQFYDKDTGETLGSLGGLGAVQDREAHLNTLRETVANAPEGKNVEGYLTTGDGRLKKVTKTGGDETNTYFVDEFQSDWHQQGRQNGYDTGVDPREIEAEVDAYDNEVFDILGADIRDLYDQVINQESFIVEGQTVNNDQYLFDELGVDAGAINDWRRVAFPESLEKTEQIKSFVDVAGTPSLKQRLDDHIAKIPEFRQKMESARAAREGVPDAPFKGNNWINLGLKRALVDAVDNGYDSFAWADSNVLSDRWSEQYRKLYETQYDTKMPSIVKKMTKQQPVHLDMAGDPHEHQELGYWVIPLTDDLKAKIKSESFPLFQETTQPEKAESEVRGYYDPANSLIRLTEASDLSTFLHEFAHFMYEMELTTGSETIESINNWYKRNADEVAAEANGYLDGELIDITADKVIEFLDLGTTGNEAEDKAIRRAVHEQFARGFEQYLMEGKAPSIELRNAFRTFARWLSQIYNAIRGQLNVNLDDEMRQVFDRLLATEEQIAAAESRARIEPMFTDAAMAGMTDAEFQAYQKRQQKVKDKQSETLRDKLIKELTRQQEAWWKAEKADLVDEELDRLKKERVYRAREVLRSKDLKMDHATVKEMVGQERTDKRGRTSVIIPPSLNKMTAKGQEGVHPDEAAAFLGYDSGSEMLNDLMTAPPIKEVAETNAEAMMKERHGDIMTDGTIEQEADAALQSEERGRLILSELKVLSRGTSQRSIDISNFKDVAADRIGKMSFREINPGLYRRAEIKAAQESARMLAEGNREGAAVAKQRQLMNFYLGKEATAAKNETMKIVDRMTRYRKKKVREEIQKAGNEYWEQITKILSRFEFRKSVSMLQVEQQITDINTWMRERMEEDGDGLVLSPAVLNEMYITHWKNVPYADLQGINDSVKNIEHVARYANKITLMDQEQQFEKLRDQWVDHIKANGDKFTNKQTRSRVEDAAKEGFSDIARRWASQLTKVPFLASWLDGGERVGMSHEILMQRLTEALDQKLIMMDEVARPVFELIEGRTKEDVKRHLRKVFIPEINDNLTGSQIIAIALNTGNAGNLKKMLLGEGWANPENEAEINFDNPKLQAILAHMSKSDWQMVQTIWDQMELLYPQLAEVHRRTTGLTPPKVEATPITVEIDGEALELKGGYYPVKYSRKRSHKAEKHAEKREAEVDSMFNNTASIQASVTAGATSERTGFYDSIQLSLDVVPEHFNEVIHYITHHDTVRQINRLIQDPAVAGAITASVGEAEFKQLKPWLNDVAKDGRGAPVKSYIDEIFQKMRFGLTLGAMGFKASTGIMQVFGLLTTAGEVGVGPTLKAIVNTIGSSWYSKAVRKTLGSPQDTQSMWDFASERSKVMNHRTETMDREIRNALERLEGKKGVMAAVQEASMKHIALIQTYMVDLPTWVAAYDKMLAETGNEDKAVQYADWAVENLQGSGATKDMATLMRSQTKLQSTFTVFMTFFSSLGNLSRELGRGTYSAPDIAAKVAFFYAIPVFLEMLMRGEFDEPEDEDDRLQKYAVATAMYPIASIPFARDAVNGLVSDYGYNMTPVSSLIERGIQGTKSALKGSVHDEDVSKAAIKNMTKLGAAWTGIPGVNQAWASSEHLYEVISEGEDFTTRELLFGPDRE